MKKENLDDFIKSEIYRLEIKQKLELVALKNQLHTTFDKLKPINLLKDTITEVSKSAELKHHLLTNAVGLLTGFISKRLVIGETSNPIKNLFGTVLEFVIANVVAKNSDNIIISVEKILQLFFGKQQDNKSHSSTNWFSYSDYRLIINWVSYYASPLY